MGEKGGDRWWERGSRRKVCREMEKEGRLWVTGLGDVRCMSGTRTGSGMGRVGGRRV